MLTYSVVTPNMEQNSKYIFGLLLLITATSCFYFLSLLCGLPLVVPILLTGATGYFLYRFLFAPLSIQAGANYISRPVLMVFIFCLVVLCKNAFTLTDKHGGWDAWAIWNLHSRYLTDPAHWKNMFANTDSEHPDYPLCLPATLAFLMRLTADHFSLLIPFLFALIITISAPLLIFYELLKKNAVVACITFYLCAQNVFYIASGMSQYADTLLALLFLAAIVSIQYVPQSRRYVAVCAALLVSGAWVKNEGAILALVFFLFYAATFFSRKNLLYTLGGTALPLLTLILFKINCPIHNDMLASVSGNTLQHIWEQERYSLIYRAFILNLNEKFYFVKIGMIVCTIVAGIQKKMPGKQSLILISCTLVYLGIYVLTHRDLNWQLGTSLDRLMHQLMPATVYVIALKFSGKNPLQSPGF